ncbi:MAG: MoxR family ATPase [Desulfovibrio sp.]|nr:MoxR family ATPase [Desulfovibrio sp.]
MKPSDIVKALHLLLDIQQPVFLWGPPGVGKSQVVAEVARARGMELCDVRAVLLDPVDLRGLPRVTEKGLAQWCPPAFLPPEGSLGRGVVFLDELNAATPLVQAACYQLILDRRIGEYELPAGWSVVAAGNREQDRSVVHRMPTALANRMVHLEFEADIDDWLAWAQKHGIRPEVTGFLRFRPTLLHTFDPKSSDRTFASPRAWEFVSRMLSSSPGREIEDDLWIGAVGMAAAAEFTGYLAVWRDLPGIDEVLAHPDDIGLSQEPAVLYALCEALAARASASCADALGRFALRLPPEFGVLLMRGCVCRDRNFVKTEGFARWAQANAEVLL